MKANERTDDEVKSVVERILQDTEAGKDTTLLLRNTSGETRRGVLETLRSRDMPILSTDGACGPG